MSEADQTLLKEAIANTILNQLTLNGVVEACKFYSIQLANNQYAEMADEDKQKILDNIKTNQEEQGKEFAPNT